MEIPRIQPESTAQTTLNTLLQTTNKNILHTLDSMTNQDIYILLSSIFQQNLNTTLNFWPALRGHNLSVAWHKYKECIKMTSNGIIFSIHMQDSQDFADILFVLRPNWEIDVERFFDPSQSIYDLNIVIRKLTQIFWTHNTKKQNNNTEQQIWH